MDVAGIKLEQSVVNEAKLFAFKANPQVKKAGIFATHDLGYHLYDQPPVNFLAKSRFRLRDILSNTFIKEKLDVPEFAKVGLSTFEYSDAVCGERYEEMAQDEVMTGFKVLEDPLEKMLDVGILMELTGDDSYRARPLLDTNPA